MALLFSDDFESQPSKWYTDKSETERGVQTALITEGANSYTVSSNPYWLDPNHASPGAGYLNLLFYRFLSEAPSGVNLSNASVTFDFRMENLTLPPSAHIYFWFQAFDERVGRFVNYVLSSNPIEVAAPGGAWQTITLTLSSDGSDWIALGANSQRTGFYGQSDNVSQALFSQVVDVGVFAYLGPDIPVIPLTGNFSLDNFSITLQNPTNFDFVEQQFYPGYHSMYLQIDTNDLVSISATGAYVELILTNGTSQDHYLFSSERVETVSGSVFVEGALVGVITILPNSEGLRLDFVIGTSQNDIHAVIESIVYLNSSSSPQFERGFELYVGDADDRLLLIDAPILVRDQADTQLDTTYTYNDVSDFSRSIWDAGGNDTLDASAMTLGLSVELSRSFRSVSDRFVGVSYGTIESVIAGSGNDIVTGNVLSSTTIMGMGGHDNLYGGAADDTLNGGEGNDNLDGGLGADELIGGNGFDVAYYTSLNQPVILDLNNVIVGSGAAAGDTFDSIDAVVGSQQGDQIYGNASSSTVILGLGGNDVLFGGAGNDTLLGGEGDDTLKGGAGADTLRGDSGTDSVTYESALQAVHLDLNNAIVGTGDALGDFFSSIEGVVGSEYDDQVYGNALSSTVIVGLGGHDALYGGAGDDSLFGDEGDDTLAGGLGADSLFGDAGYDTVTYEFEANAVRLDLNNLIAGTGAAAGDVFSSIEAVIGSNQEDLIFGNALSGTTIFGMDGHDNLYGGTQSDVLDGGEGNDNLDGGLGADTLIGGNGFDVAYYTSVNQSVTLDLNNVIAGAGAAAGDTFSGFEAVVGSQQGDQIYGNASSSTVVLALGGHDILYGGTGNDFLYGGDGSDTLYGASGADGLYGGNGFDTISFEFSGLPVRLDLNNAISGAGDAAGDVFSSIEAVIGSNQEDLIFGNALSGTTIFGMDGHDNLYGGTQSDVLDGGEGNDNLDGGLGADTLIGGNGFDVAYYTSVNQSVTLDLNNVIAGAGAAAGDTFSGFEAVVGSQQGDQIYGNASSSTVVLALGGHDILYGGTGNDWLYGGDGNDRLVGSQGADFMDGGNGIDTLVYSGENESVLGGLDRIENFDPINDNIQFLGFLESASNFESLLLNYDATLGGVVIRFSETSGVSNTFATLVIGDLMLTSTNFLFA